MKRFFLSLALLFAFATPALAQQSPEITGTPRVTVPNYGMQVGIWAVGTPVGDTVALFERQVGSTGLWTQFFHTDYYSSASSLGTLANAVATAGGDAAFLKLKQPEINTALAHRYPVIGGGPLVGSSNDPVLDAINTALATGGFQLDAHGTPSLFIP